MWKAAAGQQINLKNEPAEEDDEWETDPDFVNDVNEQEQRWGSATIVGSGRTAGAIDMAQLRKETEEADAQTKKKQLLEGTANPSFGYGGKFGVETDRMDQSAVGHEYKTKLEKHASQKDYTTGFGGKFGVQTDRVDKSAMSWDHKEKVEKHASQKDYVSGFGGKFGVQSDRQDKSAMGWDHIEKVEKHESQKDYVKGFGGKFGVQSDRQDKSAVGWDHHEAPQKHESQTDHKIGFGGKFGLQTDRVDKSAASFNEEPAKVGTNYTKVKPDIGGAKPSDLRAKFENMSTQEPPGSKSSEKMSTPKKTIHAKATMFANNSQPEVPVPAAERTMPKSLDSSKTAFLKQNAEKADEPMEKAATPQRMDPSKMAQFTAQQKTVSSSSSVFESTTSTTTTSTTKKLDQSKTAFLTQMNLPQPQQQIAQSDTTNAVEHKHEEEQIYENFTESFSSQAAVTSPVAAKVEHKHEEEQIYENFTESFSSQAVTSPVAAKEISPTQESLYANAPSPASGEEVEYYTPDEIVDTGISAVALYDYQAAADDEISFDPDDTITHIEKIDEGWWRGLCKGKYGLFPANYVQVDGQ